MEELKAKYVQLLRQLGFKPEEVDDIGLSFEYEGLTLIIATESSNQGEWVTLFAPNIYEVNEANALAVLEAIATLCQTIKYVQPHIMFEKEVWINYIHYLGDNELTEDLIEHMVDVLEVAVREFYSIITKVEEGEDDDD